MSALSRLLFYQSQELLTQQHVTCTVYHFSSSRLLQEPCILKSPVVPTQIEERLCCDYSAIKVIRLGTNGLL